MPERIPVPQFIGGSNRLISPQASPNMTINLFPEKTQVGGKVQVYLRPTEGIRTHAQFASIDTSELFAQDDRGYACCGTVFGEFLGDGSSIARGTIAYDGTRATMCSNGTAGHQVMIVSAGHVYIYDTISDVFSEVDFGGRLIAMCEFMDGYFFALLRNSRTVYYSDLEDGLSWDFTFQLFERSWGSDNISFIKRSGRQLWLVGTKTGEVWADVGSGNTIFAPVQGVFLDQGCIAPFTGQRDGKTLTWLNQDERGGGLVVRANGYQPQDISTYAIDAMIQRDQNLLSNSEAFIHQNMGHVFYWLHLDGSETTPTLDLSEEVWSERAIWEPDNARYVPHIARCHCYVFERHFVGVRESGIVYELSTNFLTDGIVP